MPFAVLQKPSKHEDKLIYNIIPIEFAADASFMFWPQRVEDIPEELMQEVYMILNDGTKKKLTKRDKSYIIMIGEDEDQAASAVVTLLVEGLTNGRRTADHDELWL